MLARAAVMAVVGFLAGAVAAAEPWKDWAVPRSDPSVDVRREVVFGARLRWFESAARSLELGRGAR